MNSASERPRTSSRLWVRTASVETQANNKRGEVAKGELVSAAGDHVKREGAVLSLVLKAVAGVGAGQGAQRHRPRHEASFGVRFAGRDKLVHLIGEGEASPRRWWGFAERLDRAGQIGDDCSNGNQLAALTLHGFYSPMFPRQDRGTIYHPARWVKPWIGLRPGCESTG